MKKKDTLLHYVSSLKKAELIDLAADLHVFFPTTSMSVGEMRQMYAKAILNHPLDIMSQLPYGDLKLIEELKDDMLSVRNTPAMFNYCRNLMFYYGLCDEHWDDNGNYWITLPEDMAQIMLPHIDEILNDRDQQLRIGVESIVEGMANLYGLVRLDQVKQMIKKSYEVSDDDAVDDIWNEIREHSLLIRWMEWIPVYSTDDIALLPDNEFYYLSRYGWDSPKDLLDEINKRDHLVPNRKEYSDFDLIGAARWPIPEIPNSKKTQFFSYLKKVLGLTEYDCYEAAFNLWYRAVHEGDECFEDGQYTSYFLDNVLSWSERELDAEGLKEAFRHLTDYMNNVPRWILKGHSPAEVTPVQDMTRPPHFSLGPNMRRMGYREDDIQHLIDAEWGKSANPVSSFRIPGRNDPCPCGSGKKYKNCHGRDN
jgi:hypothetical protein